MRAHVHIKAGRLVESLLTHCAPVRPDTGVFFHHAGMVKQMGYVSKCPFASLACVNSVAGVRLHVHLERACTAERLIAHFAFVRTDIGVASHMPCKQARVLVRFLTLFTFMNSASFTVRNSLCVLALTMLIKCTAVAERLFALPTFVLFVIGVVRVFIAISC